MALFANGVELLLCVEHLLRRVRNLVELRHERLHRNFLVPDVAELPAPRAHTTYTLGAVAVWDPAVFAVKLTLSGFAAYQSNDLSAAIVVSLKSHLLPMPMVFVL